MPSSSERFPEGALKALAPLFKPKSVAVIGASATRGKQGNTAVRYMLKAGYQGNFYPINPGGGEIEGVKAYKSLAEVPEPIDTALMVIPAAMTASSLKECVAHGMKSMVIGSVGYSEMGTDEGRALQAEVVSVAKAGNLRLVGPNTNGIFNATDRVPLGYSSAYGDELTPGPVSVAAHSGALFNSLAPRLRDMRAGLSKFVPLGNEADLSMLDFLEYFIEDPDTGIIGLIIEGISDGARFRALAEDARQAGKPIVALKLGRSKAGQGATQAHSSRLAGSARAFDAIFREYGIAQVPTVEALAGACGVLLGTKVRVPNTALVSVTTTGGGASMMADFAEKYGIKLAGNPDGSWGGKVADYIATIEGAGVVRNPTDTGVIGGQQNMTPLFEAQEADGWTGPTMVFTHPLPTLKGSQVVAEYLIGRHHRTGSPVVVVAPDGLVPELRDAYSENGLPFFRDVTTAFDSLQAYYATLPHDKRALDPVPAGLKDLGAKLTAKTSFLSETESAAILKAAGVPMVESRVVASADEAKSAGKAAGYPVVLKALAPDVAHKAAAGFVIASIADEAALTKAVALMDERIAKAGFKRADVQVILQPMMAAKAEIILGVSNEDPLGHFLVAGLGGIYTEILDEVLLLPIPVARATIRERLAASKLGRLVHHIGGDAVLDQVTSALAALQGLIQVHGEAIESIDVNPLLVGEKSCIAVDALIVPRKV
jgi:acyl-CoA synthetase (NDP forming)